MSASFILGTSEILNIEDTLKLARDNGGATLIPIVVGMRGEVMYVNQDGIKDGYMVSVAGKGVALFEGELDAENVERYIRTTFLPYRDAFESSVTRVPFFGLWKSERAWYLDVSLYIEDKATAVHLARTTGELAIWDNAAGEALSMFE